MSELSSAYSEYERLSNLFRQLNDASLLARRVLLGINPPPTEEQRMACDQLSEALLRLGDTQEVSAAQHKPSALTLYEVLRQVPNGSREVSPDEIAAIRRRVGSGLAALTPEDLETIDTLTDALDSASEVLFRRVQR
jgi:hypothetical protein